MAASVSAEKAISQRRRKKRLQEPRGVPFAAPGFVLFNNAHGDIVDKVLLPHARAIADADDNHVPVFSWGFAVLAATYRALCDASTRTSKNSNLTWCPLLLLLWSYQRVYVGRLDVDHSPYEKDLYGEGADDGPTMGTLWCNRVNQRCYYQYVAELDMINYLDFIWEPYSIERLAERAPEGLATGCTQDRAYFLTTTALVYDMVVEVHCPG